MRSWCRGPARLLRYSLGAALLGGLLLAPSAWAAKQVAPAWASVPLRQAVQALSITGNIQLVIRSNGKPGLKVLRDKDEADQLLVRESHGSVQLSTQDKSFFSWLFGGRKPVKVVLTSPRLMALHVKGKAVVNLQPFRGKVLAVYAADQSSVTIRGSVYQLLIAAEGKANVDATRLIVKEFSDIHTQDQAHVSLVDDKNANVRALGDSNVALGKMQAPVRLQLRGKQFFDPHYRFVANGDFVLDIKRAKVPSIRMVAGTNGTEHIVMQKRDGATYITTDATGKPPEKPLLVMLRVPDISYLRVENNVQVVGRHVRAKQIEIVHNAYQPMDISGRLGLREVTQNTIAPVKLYWVEGNKLVVHDNGSGRLSLAGAVGDMYARVSGIGSLDAQYLRAQTVNVQTVGNGSAKVLPLRALDAFAYDGSLISYYKHPTEQRLTHDPTAQILQLAWRQ